MKDDIPLIEVDTDKDISGNPLKLILIGFVALVVLVIFARFPSLIGLVAIVFLFLFVCYVLGIIVRAVWRALEGK